MTRQFQWSLYEQGHKVITRNGKEVTQLTRFDTVEKYIYFGIVDSQVCSWTESGHFHRNLDESGWDLQIVVEDTMRYMPLYENLGWCSESDARENANSGYSGILEINLTTKEVRII